MGNYKSFTLVMLIWIAAIGLTVHGQTAQSAQVTYSFSGSAAQIVDPGNLRPLASFLQPTHWSIQAAGCDDPSSCRRAWDIRQDHLLSTPRETAARFLVGFAVVVSMPTDDHVMRAVWCVLKGQDGHNNLRIVGKQELVVFDRLLDRIK